MKRALLILAALANISICAEILCIFPVPIHSHISVYNAVTMGLLDRGHEITLISSQPRDNERNHENLTLIDVSFIAEEFDMLILRFLQHSINIMDRNPFIDLMNEIFDSPDVKDLLESDKKFDLLFMELFGYSPFHAIAEVFDVPVVGITAADGMGFIHGIMGNIAHPVAHPDRFIEFPIAKSFWERVQSVVNSMAYECLLIPIHARDCDQIVEKYFPENKIKSFSELLSNVDIHLNNAHPVMGYIRPILPNTIPLGFLHINEPDPLPEILQEILDKNENGVIYVSFGTVFSPKHFGSKLRVILEAFNELPYLVLFKYDGELENSPKNVILNKWFPQSDLLAHSNVKVFITQGGQQSMEESIIRKVPMLIMPIASDQRSNAIRAEERKIARILDIHQDDKINSEDIKNAILDLINDKSYKTNIENLARLVEDVSMTSRDKAVWWIEYVIRNRGAKHFSYEQKNIPFYQYHYYDVIAFMVAVITLIIVTIVLMLRCIAMCIRILVVFKVKRD